MKRASPSARALGELGLASICTLISRVRRREAREYGIGASRQRAVPSVLGDEWRDRDFRGYSITLLC